MKLKLQTASLLGDWFPFANNFRISAGAMFNGNKFALTENRRAQATRSTAPSTLLRKSARSTLRWISQGSTLLRHRLRAPHQPRPVADIRPGRYVPGQSQVQDRRNLWLRGERCAMRTAEERRASRAIQARRQPSQFKYYPVISLGLAYTF